MSTTVISSTKDVFKVAPTTSNTCVSSDVSTFRPESKLNTCITEIAPVGTNFIPKTEFPVVITDGQTSFTLSNAPVDPDQFAVFDINGQRQRYGTDFTISGNTLSFVDDNFILETSDKLQITYHIN